MALTLASATTTATFGIQVTGIVGSPSTGEELVVYDCSRQGATHCASSTWTSVTSPETLGHVAVTSITAIRLCKGKYYRCSNQDTGVHLGYLGCSSGSWVTGGSAAPIKAATGDAGLDPTRAGGLVVPWAYPTEFEIGGVPSDATGVSCTPSPANPENTVLREHLGRLATGTDTGASVSRMPSAPFTVDQLGKSPAVGAAETWAPLGMPATSLGFRTREGELFVAKSPTSGATSAPFYDIGTTPITGEWEQDPSIPIGCTGGSCPLLEALIPTETTTSSDASSLAPLVAIASNGQAELFTAFSAQTPIGAQGTTPPSPVSEPLTVKLDLETKATGSVTSTPPGIDCPGTCTGNFTVGKSVTLTASPGAKTVIFYTFSFATTSRGFAVSLGCGNPCAVSSTDLAAYQTVTATFAPFKAVIGAESGKPTGTDLVQVRLTDCGVDIGTSTWTVSGIAKESDATTCVFVTTLLPGTYVVTLQATSKTGTLVVDATATLHVKASVQFQYHVPPSTNSPVKVTFNACKLSSGITTFKWSVGGGSPQEATCDVELTMTTGPQTVTLTGVDQSGHTASTSAVITVVVYSASSAATPECSVLSVGATACWREFVTWTGDVLSGKARYPDYAVFAVSAGIGVVGGSVSAVLTCDGNWFAGVGVSAGLSLDLPVEAMAGYGWQGDPVGPEPLEQDVDSFITGSTNEIDFNLLIVGVNWVESTHATGPKDGVQFYASTPGLGISTSAGVAGPITGDTQPPANAVCGPEGVIGTSEFQSLANIPNLPNAGYRTMEPTTTSSTPVTLGGGTTTVYVTGSTWAPGSKVSVGIHAEDPATYDLGTTIADDTGTIGEPLTLPGLAPGLYQIVLKGFAPTLTAETETIPFRVPGTTAPSAPTNVTAVAGDQSAKVSWTAATTNGTAIESYTVTSTPGGKTCSPASLSSLTCTVSGLTNGVPYTFTVTAKNHVGTSLSSKSSEPVTPEPPVPAAPTKLVPMAGNAKVTLSWTPSVGATSYLVYDSTTPTVSTTGLAVCTTTATHCSVGDLKNGTEYYFVVLAKNAGGPSDPSTPAHATPEAPSTAPSFTSSSTAYFALLHAGSFSIETTGEPAAKLTESGKLPKGLKFATTGGGKATISGTTLTVGTHTVKVTATNGVAAASEMLTIVVGFAPAFVTGNSTTFVVGTHGADLVATLAYPFATLTDPGTLPSWVSFHTNGNGTGTISGTPPPGTGGVYKFTITATNHFGKSTQHFTLTVDQPPTFISGSTTTFTSGTPKTFDITTSGYPAAKITESGSLPRGVSFKATGGGMATISGKATTAKKTVYKVKLTAANGVGKAVTQTFTLTVS